MTQNTTLSEREEIARIIDPDHVGRKHGSPFRVAIAFERADAILARRAFAAPAETTATEAMRGVNRSVPQAWLDRANLIESSARDLLEQVDDTLSLPKRYLKRAYRHQLDLMADRLQVALNVEEPSLSERATEVPPLFATSAQSSTEIASPAKSEKDLLKLIAWEIVSASGDIPDKVHPGGMEEWESWLVAAKGVLGIVRRHALAAQPSTVTAKGEAVTNEIRRLKCVIERDRSTVAMAVTAIRKAIDSREHLRDPGRGPFAWDDEQYQREFGDALDEISVPVDALRKIAHDWSDALPTSEAIYQARLAATPPTPSPVTPEEWIIEWPNGDTTRVFGFKPTPGPGIVSIKPVASPVTGALARKDEQ